MLKTQRLSMLAEERHQVSVLACDQGSNENKPCKTEHICVEDRKIHLLIPTLPKAQRTWGLRSYNSFWHKFWICGDRPWSVIKDLIDNFLFKAHLATPKYVSVIRRYNVIMRFRDVSISLLPPLLTPAKNCVLSLTKDKSNLDWVESCAGAHFEVIFQNRRHTTDSTHLVMMSIWTQHIN